MAAVHVRGLLPGAPVEPFQCKYTDESVTSTYGFVRVMVINELVVDMLMGPAVMEHTSVGVEVLVGVNVIVGVKVCVGVNVIVGVKVGVKVGVLLGRGVMVGVRLGVSV